jgi:hypothetical protein
MSTIAPYLGYAASLCLVIALLVGNDLQFRWFNTAGNIFFIVYALVLNAVPVLLTNLVLLCINGWYLAKVYRKKERFDMLEFRGDEKLARQFLQFYQKDIAAYFPKFEAAVLQGNLNFVVTRDLVIANMFSARVSANGDATVLLNYTLKKYRDYKVGSFIFEQCRDYLIQHGIKRIVYTEVANKNHRQFLYVMGFEPVDVDGVNCMAKLLQPV